MLLPSHKDCFVSNLLCSTKAYEQFKCMADITNPPVTLRRITETPPANDLGYDEVDNNDDDDDDGVSLSSSFEYLPVTPWNNKSERLNSSSSSNSCD